MEHFCTLFIFRGLFFNFSGTLFVKIPIEKPTFYKTPKIYSIYEDNRQRKIARTKGKLFSYLGDNQAHVKTKFKFLTTIFKMATHIIKTSFTIYYLTIFSSCHDQL